MFVQKDLSQYFSHLFQVSVPLNLTTASMLQLTLGKYILFHSFPLVSACCGLPLVSTCYRFPLVSVAAYPL